MTQEKTKTQERKTQKTLIANHLKQYGKISAWGAINLYRCTRLGARIFQLRQEGWQILTNHKQHQHSLTGNHGCYAVYILEKAV